jgi:ADP-ribosylation factor-like protein 13B
LVLILIIINDRFKCKLLFIIDKEFQEVSPTVGYEPHELKYNTRDLTLYDLGGGHRVRDIWKHYLSESYGFIFVIDASNRNRITECRNVFASFVENDKVAGKPILM